MALHLDLKVGEALVVNLAPEQVLVLGENRVRITMGAKRGQLARLSIEADRSIPIRVERPATAPGKDAPYGYRTPR